LRGAAQRGGCCRQPCQPSPYWLCPLGKAAAPSAPISWSYLYPEQTRSGRASLHHIPGVASGMRAAQSSAGTSRRVGHGVGRLPAWHGVTTKAAWSYHHCGTEQLSPGHDATAHPAAAQPHVLPMLSGPFGVPGGP